MSLDVYLEEVRPTEVFWANITHNLVDMADEAGIYKHLWRPEELGIKAALELIEPITAAIALMESDPERFKKHNPPNGWGSYEHFLPWLRCYLDACKKFPSATVRASR